MESVTTWVYGVGWVVVVFGAWTWAAAQRHLQKVDPEWQPPSHKDMLTDMVADDSGGLFIFGILSLCVGMLWPLVVPYFAARWVGRLVANRSLRTRAERRRLETQIAELKAALQAARQEIDADVPDPLTMMTDTER